MNVDLGSISPEELGVLWGTTKVDVLISCAPCTDFSQKNAENYIVDKERNTLVGRSFAFVEYFQPSVFVMENVPEMLHGKHKHHADNLIQHLKENGYSVAADVHNLAGYGLPQLRRRALIIAIKGNETTLPEIIIDNPAEYKTVRDAIAHLSSDDWDIEAGDCHDEDPIHTAPGFSAVNAVRVREIPQNGGSWIDLPDNLKIPSMLKEGRRKGSFPDIYGRMKWDEPARTITRECGNLGNGRYLHPLKHRLVSVREMSLLQGFPTDYPFKGTRHNKYNQIGDSVPPLVSSIIASHVAAILSLNPR
jgi:DNA (cytosine-5)-methyltransferase 1